MSKLHLYDFIDPPALVEKKKKETTFTVSFIGGPEEIKKWREIQAAKEENYRLRLKDRDLRLAEFESTFGSRLDTPTIHTTSWSEKKAFVDQERKRLRQTHEIDPWEYHPKPKQKASLIQRIKGWFVHLFESANLS